MGKKRLFFIIFCFISLFLSISVIGFAQVTPPAGGGVGGAGAAYSVAGCWDYTTEAGCTNTSDAYQCSWHPSEQTAWGWCEEIGCWKYTDFSSCAFANCT